MSYQITEQDIDEILNKPGKVRGVVFKTDYRFIVDKFGEGGVKRVEEELERMKCSFSYKDEIDNMSFYPIGMRTISLIAIHKALGIDREGIKEMGMNAPKFSLMIKFFMRHFLSPEKIFEKAGEMWEKHYTVGALKPTEMDLEKRCMKASIYDIELHPILSDYFCGYFSFILKMGVGEDVSVVEEQKESEDGNKYHEFTFTW